LSGRADNALADSTLDVVTLKTGKADSADLVEVEAFDGNGDTGEVFNVLTVGTDHNDGVAVSAGIELISVADAGETLSSCCVEVSAGGGDVVADVIGLPLAGQAGDGFVGAASVGEEVVVDGISARPVKASKDPQRSLAFQHCPK